MQQKTPGAVVSAIRQLDDMIGIGYNQVLPRGENRAKRNMFTPYRIDADGNRYELSGEKWLIIK